MVASVTAINPQDPGINQASGTGVIQRITQAIRQASARTGVDFSYLLNKATQESSLDPNAKAATSSATGLFQFTQQTWLRMLKEHGEEYGLGMYADHIKLNINGVAQVDDPRMRNAILALRKDPAVSAMMSGELDKENYASLKASVGGKIGPTELYLAHFLGAGGAADFINSMRADPQAVAANVLPDAAASNPAVFYEKDGSAKSVTQIYKHFAQKFNHAPKIEGMATMLADADSSSASVPVSALSRLAGTSKAPLPYTPTSTSSVASNYSPPVTSSVHSGPSSLFAAMVLAQSDFGHAGSPLSGIGEHNGRKQDSAIQLLGAIG